MKDLSKHIVLLFGLIISVHVSANDPFVNGVDAYEAKDYPLATENFQEVIADQENNIAGYFNLGVSEMADKHYGQAIWAFEKVLKLKPNDPEAAEYLSLCHNELGFSEDWSPILNSFQSGIYSVSSNTWSILAITFSILLCLAIILFKKSSSISIKRIMIVTSFFLILLCIGGILAANSSKQYSESTNYAVVTKTSIPTFLEDGKTAKDNLDEGIRVYFPKLDSSEFINVQISPDQEVLVKFEDLSFI